MALYEKLNSIDLNDTNSMRSLFLDFIKEINYQKEEINQLRRGCDQLRTEKEELSKRVTKLERYSSFMCLTFHGVENGGEYPVHKIVELIRSVQIPIETHDIAACHYLPGKGKRRSIIVKFLYNHQRDSVWFNRNSFFDPVSGAKIHINERLAENDRDLYNYCRKEKNLLTTTNKNQVRVKFSENDTTWYPVDSRHQVDYLVGTNGNTENEWGMETVEMLAQEPYVNKKTPLKRSRQVAFQSPQGSFQKHCGTKQFDKLDRLCCLTEKVFNLLVEKESPPSKKSTNLNDECNNFSSNQSSEENPI